MQEMTRWVDTVTVKGSEHPMRFYTINLSPEVILNKADPMFETAIDDKKKIRKDTRKEF